MLEQGLCGLWRPHVSTVGGSLSRGGLGGGQDLRAPFTPTWRAQSLRGRGPPPASPVPVCRRQPGDHPARATHSSWWAQCPPRGQQVGVVT